MGLSVLCPSARDAWGCGIENGSSWKEQIAQGADAERAAQDRQESGMGMTVLGEEDYGLC